MREMQNSTNHNPHRNHQRSRNSTSSSSGFNNIRNRTHSWSNVDKRSTSAKPISAHSRQSSAIIPDSRYRTTSEGNAHFDIKPRSIGKSRREKFREINVWLDWFHGKKYDFWNKSFEFTKNISLQELENQSILEAHQWVPAPLSVLSPPGVPIP